MDQSPPSAAQAQVSSNPSNVSDTSDCSNPSETSNKENRQPNLAQHVCSNCKSKKKKCSKHLPSCESCTKLLLQCDYGASSSNPSSPGKNKDSKSELQSFSSLLAAFSEYSYSPEKVPSSSLAGSISGQALMLLLAEKMDVPSVHLAYFQTIHVWLPILSKERYLTRMETFITTPSIELSGLLLAMALIIQTPPETGRAIPMATQLYFQAKALHTVLVSRGKPTIEVVQAGLLISLYEHGHGMTEATVTMAACSRLALKLNLEYRRNGTSSQMANIQDSEFGRTWWGFVILDRFFNLGVPADEIHLVADSQILRNIHMELPNDDEEIQEPERKFDLTPSGIAIRQPTTALGPFCRTAHAAHLLGQALDFKVKLSIDGDLDEKMWMEIDKNLMNLAMSLYQQAINGWEECCGAIGVCLSARLTLHEARWQAGVISTDVNTPPDEDTQYTAATFAIRSTIRMVVEISKNFLADFEFIDLPSLPLPATFAVFFSAFLHIQLAVGSEEIFTDEWNSDFKNLKGALGHFSKRWDVGRRYLKHLDILLAEAHHSTINDRQ